MTSNTKRMPNLCVIPARALSDNRLSHRDLRALLAVGMYTNHAGKGVWASQTTMADRSNMSRQQMNEALKRLEAYGYIVKRQRKSPNGGMMTCMIDVLLDEPASATPVPDLGTPPVPATGTPPVPDLGTETSSKNEELPMLQRVRDEVDVPVPAQYAPDLDMMLAQARNPDAVRRELVALNSGMHGSFSWEIIGRAVHDMVVSGVPVTPRALRKFCEGASPTPTSAPSGSPRKRGVDIAKLTSQLMGDPPPDSA